MEQQHTERGARPSPSPERGEPTRVAGSFNYLAATRERPQYFIQEPATGPSSRPRPESEKHTVPVYNGRLVATPPHLDREGIELVRQRSAVRDFYDAGEVRSVYYPEVAALLRRVTGATEVFVFDHNVRCAPMDARGENGARSPVKFAHNDYTLQSGPQRVRDLLPDRADALLQHRFAVINVWRPIRGPVQEHPLAVCDAKTMERDDFIATDLVYRDRVGEIYSVAFRERHRWLYFPQMESDEAILLKCYDSAEDGRARFTAHSAFEDPTSPPDAPPRESIEARSLVFFSTQ